MAFKLALICFLALATYASAAVAPAISVRATNEYYFSTSETTFLQAWAFCKNSNRKFVSIPTAAQNEALADALTNLGASSGLFWIGGLHQRNGFLSKWFWMDGQETFNYVNWASVPNIVSTSTIDYCTAFSYNASTKKGNWSAVPCGTTKYFICAI